jgi:hypothetical protein
MLIGLLKAIYNRPFASLEQLSQEMNVSYDLMENMVADLSKRGYLKTYENCFSACDDCSMSSACEGQVHPKIWTLTDKGRELAGRK